MKTLLLLLVLQLPVPAFLPVPTPDQITPPAAAPKVFTYSEVKSKALADGEPFLVLVGADWCESCNRTKEKLAPLFDSGRAAYFDYEDAQKFTWTNQIPQIVAYSSPAPGGQWAAIRKVGELDLAYAQGMMIAASMRAGWSDGGGEVVEEASDIPQWRNIDSKWFFGGGSATVGHLAGPNHGMDPEKLRGLTVDERDRLHSADHQSQAGRQSFPVLSQWRTVNAEPRRTTTTYRRTTTTRTRRGLFGRRRRR